MNFEGNFVVRTFSSIVVGVMAVALAAPAGAQDPANALIAADDMLAIYETAPKSAFRHRTLKKLEVTKARKLVSLVELGEYVDAAELIERGLFLRSDGCSKFGVPEPDDWVTDCALQQEIFDQGLLTQDFLLAGVDLSVLEFVDPNNSFLPYPDSVWDAGTVFCTACPGELTTFFLAVTNNGAAAANVRATFWRHSAGNAEMGVRFEDTVVTSIGPGETEIMRLSAILLGSGPFSGQVVIEAFDNRLVRPSVLSIFGEIVEVD